MHFIKRWNWESEKSGERGQRKAMIPRSLLLLLFAIFASSDNNIPSTPDGYIKCYKNVLSNFSRIGRLLFADRKYLDNTLYGDPNVYDNEEFDFIVVGSGPSGSVIANRLTEISNWKVLLLEAGGEADPLVEVPSLVGSLQFTDYAWGYVAEKEEGYCLGCPQGRLWWPRGQVLGGSTIINYMIYIRGNKRDYNRWAKMGNPGWSYKDVYPYFLKSEDANIELADQWYHIKGGYLGVSDVPYRTDSAKAFVKAAQEAGLPYVDYNGKTQLGVSFVQSTTKRGLRYSAEKSFLRPIRKRKNLKILLNAIATEILLNPATKEVLGIKYLRNGQYYTARAKKEVILSAGGLNSPQLLMLSGIGPKDHLTELGIPVIQDLPVGQKLYDHIAFAGISFIVNDSIVYDQEKLLSDLGDYYRFLKFGEGPVTSIGGVEALAYLKTNVSKERVNYPDIELLFVGGSINTDFGVVYRRMFSISQEIYDAVWKPLEGKYVFQVLPMLIHPKSTGYMKLQSKNPLKWPKFYPNYLSDPENHDVRTFIAGIREIQRISRSPALQKYGARIVSTPIPGCETYTFDSDEYWACAVRHLTPSFYHQVSTCKMGASGDKEAVVNNKLKVYGVKNLRVADTSVIPLTLCAHTMAPAYMIGEKAADLIKEDWMGPLPSRIAQQIDIRFG